MRVAIDISPISDTNSVRGVGTYTNNLTSALKKIKDGPEIITFSGVEVPSVDLVHYPYFDLFFHTLPIKSTIPRIVTIHDVIPLVFPKQFPTGIKGKYNHFLQKRALQNTDAIICDSNISKKDIVEKLGYPDQKIHVIYLAPSGSFRPLKNNNFEQIKSKYNLPNKFFLFVGDVNWNKNIINLLKAVEKTRVNLVMVGKSLTDTNLMQVKEIDKTINNLSISGLIKKTGYITNTELSIIYNLAQATIVPSVYEGFGLPVLESMACGTPVICSNTSSVKEIAGDDVIYFDPYSPQKISESIGLFLSFKQDKLRNIKDRCLKHALLFNWEKVAQQTFEVYKKFVQ